jgi:hypothetical protein
MDPLMVLAGVAYLGIGAFCASRWFHHKDLVSVVLVTLFWPVILGLSFFIK